MAKRIKLRDGSATDDVRLDRLVQFDERSREYPVRALLGKSRKPRNYTWACHHFLDQLKEGACVGFAVTHELAARPAPAKYANDVLARVIYKQAQKIDPWPGESYEGTSVLAGVKAAQQITGRFTSYRWAFGIADVLDALGYLGPVVLGTNWYDTMFNTDAAGYLRIGRGRVAGGHAYLLRGVNYREEYVLGHNSWGQKWGQAGTFKLTFPDLDRLLREQGEAVVLQGRN